MRSFKAAPEVLSAWMDERKLTAAELSRQTGIDAGILRKIMTGRETARQHPEPHDACTLLRPEYAGADRCIFRTITTGAATSAAAPVCSHNVYCVRPASNLQFDGICGIL